MRSLLGTFLPRAAFFAGIAMATSLFLAPVSLPAGGAGGGLPLDKVGHVVLLAFLGLLAARAWPERRAAAFAGLVLYAVAIEGLQALTPWRSADLWDALAGAAGAHVIFAVPRPKPV